MDINENFVKLTGKWGPVLPGLIKETDEEIPVVIANVKFTAAIVKIEHQNNQDGTFDRVYVLKLFQ